MKTTGRPVFPTWPVFYILYAKNTAGARFLLFFFGKKVSAVKKIESESRYWDKSRAAGGRLPPMCDAFGDAYHQKNPLVRFLF